MHSIIFKHNLLTILALVLVFTSTNSHAQAIEMDVPAGGSAQNTWEFHGIIMNPTSVTITVSGEDSALVEAETDRFWQGDAGVFVTYTVSVDEAAEVGSQLSVNLGMSIRNQVITINLTLDHSINVLEPPPSVDFTAEPLSGEAPLLVQFTDLSEGDISTWLWEFGDNTTSDSINPSHTYTEPGEYTVSLTVANADSVASTLERRRFISVAEPFPIIVLSEDSLMYGDVPVDSTVYQSLIIHNVGGAPLEIIDIVHNRCWFDVEFEGECEIAPGDSEVVQISFCPLSPRATQALFYIASNDPENNILDLILIGRGIPGNGINPDTETSPVGKYSLFDAYPNPFNSSTKISYSLSGNSHVSIQIFDINGQLVDVLIDQFMPAGRHVVEWDGGGMSAGVYMVKLENSIVKVVLVR